MSALGQKQTSDSRRLMSAIHSKADIGTWLVRPAQQPRQFGEIHRDPPRLVFGEWFGR
jgi:hypothetical protein